MKKIAVSSLVSLFVLSCAISAPNNSSRDTSSRSQVTGYSSPVKEDFSALAKKYNFAELEREYKPFSTKALSDGYVHRMFTKFLAPGTGNPVQVIRQLEFARYLKDVKTDTTYFDSLKTIITAENSIFTKIDTTSGVPEKKTAESPTFGVFVNSLNPFPGAPTATAANPIGTTSFTANWVRPGGNVTGYKLFVDGVQYGSIIAANATSQSVTGVTSNASHNYYIVTVNSLGDSAPSSTITFNTTAPVNGGFVTTLAGGTTAGYVDGVGTNAQFKLTNGTTSSCGMTLDSSGNLYIADTINQLIRKMTPAGVVTTLAGKYNQSGSTNGQGTNAQFYYPVGTTVDSSGNIYVSDKDNYRIRKLDVAGVVTTFAGSTNGSADGTGTNAQFRSPSGVAFDSLGNLYVSDTGSNKIRKITPAGVVTTLAGGGASGFAYGYADATGTNALFNSNYGLAVDSSDNVYVADQGNQRIRKITPGGVVTTLAGSSYGFLDETGANAKFATPLGVALDSSGNVYVADTYNNRIRKITPGGVVTTLAGSTQGYVDGIGTSAKFYRPSQITLDPSGNVYVSDTYNNRIRKIDISTGLVSTLTGNNNGSVDGIMTNAQFNYLQDVALDSSGNVYVADYNNYKIRKIDISTGLVSTLAGDGNAGFVDNVPGTSAQFQQLLGIAVDSTGNVYVADYGNHRIRRIANDVNHTVTTLAGSLPRGFADGTGANAKFKYPTELAYYGGNLYVVDGDNQKIRTINISTGVVSTLAGGGSAATTTSGFNDGIGVAALFSYPRGIAINSGGTFAYVVDGSSNNKIRKIDISTGAVSTFASVGGNLSSLAGGITVDPYENVYVVNGISKISKISPAGVVSNFVGGTRDFKDNATGTNAWFMDPSGLATDSFGNIYVADSWNNRVRKIQ